MWYYTTISNLDFAIIWYRYATFLNPIIFLETIFIKSQFESEAKLTNGRWVIFRCLNFYAFFFVCFLLNTSTIYTDKLKTDFEHKCFVFTTVFLLRSILTNTFWERRVSLSPRRWHGLNCKVDMGDSLQKV